MSEDQTAERPDLDGETFKWGNSGESLDQTVYEVVIDGWRYLWEETADDDRRALSLFLFARREDSELSNHPDLDTETVPTEVCEALFGKQVEVGDGEGTYQIRGHVRDASGLEWFYAEGVGAESADLFAVDEVVRRLATGELSLHEAEEDSPLIGEVEVEEDTESNELTVAVGTECFRFGIDDRMEAWPEYLHQQYGEDSDGEQYRLTSADVPEFVERIITEYDYQLTER